MKVKAIWDRTVYGAIPKKISVSVSGHFGVEIALIRNFVDGQEHMERMKHRVLMPKDVRQKFGPDMFPQAKR